MKKPTFALLFALVLALTAVALLEVVLQVAAIAVWFTTSRSGPSTRPGEQVVLCVGDSLTFGEGTSDRQFAYPAQLEALLRKELGPDCRVVNQGRAGHDSRSVLERLAGQLDEHCPDLVYAVVGANDYWSRPEKLDVTATTPKEAPRAPFRWEWRTGRLLAWTFGSKPSGQEVLENIRTGYVTKARVRSELSDTAWLFHGIPFVFTRQGACFMGTLAMEWFVRGKQLVLSTGDGTVASFKWQVDEGKLSLHHEDVPFPLEMVATEFPDGIDLDLESHSNGWQLMRDKQPAAAARVFRRSIESAKDGAPHDRAALVSALLSQGDRAAADEQVRWLRERYENESTRTVAITEAYIQALDTIGDKTACEPLVIASVRAHPGSSYLWEKRAWYAYRGEDLQSARDAIGKSLALTPANSWRMRVAAMIEGKAGNPRSVASYIVRIHRRDKSRANGIEAFRTAGAKVTKRLLDEVLTELDAPPAERTAMHELLAVARDDSVERVEATYEEHLRQIVRLCRERGATAVLASYPWHHKRTAAIKKKVASAEGTTFVDVATELSRQLAGKKNSVFFVAGGRCNDAGYAIMAAAIARDAVLRLSR